MKRTSHIMSFATTVVALCAWLAISNHCALGLAMGEQEPVKNECPFHAKPSAPPKQKQSKGSPCCKILRATIVAKTKKIAPVIVDLAPADLLFAELIVFAPPKISLGFETLDTGPPGKTSFVQLIGSVQAQAPPAIA